MITSSFGPGRLPPQVAGITQSPFATDVIVATIFDE